MRKLSLGCVTLLDATPPELVTIAADAGYQGLSLAVGAPLITVTFGQVGLSHSFVNDAKLRKETVSRAADRGIPIDLMEGFILSPAFNESDWRKAMDVTVDMGITRCTLLMHDPDRDRMTGNLVKVCQMARERNLDLCFEHTTRSTVPTIAAARNLIDRGFAELTILVDALHLARGGETPADVAGVPPDMIGCSQFCDGPAFSPSDEAYAHESLFEREIPGRGELPLRELLNAVPSDRIIYLEVPKESLKQQGLSPTQRARRVLDGMREFLAA